LTYKTAAETAATNAASSATTAGTQATTATTQATNSSNSASASATSATAAAASATNASSSSTAAGTSATNAANSASAASTSATNAANSATAAAGSASTATTQATTATNQATTATTQATNASNSATAAGTSATNAANSATAAGTSATNAATSATNAASSATAAAGSASAASTSATNAATSESNAASTLAGALTKTDNLASLSNVGTARTNLGLTALATTTPGTNVATALGVNVGTAGSVVVNGGALGTPASGNLANCTFPTLNQNTTGTAANVTGTVAVANGGTGLNSLTAGYIPYGNGTGAFSSGSGFTTDGSNVTAAGAFSTTNAFYANSGTDVYRIITSGSVCYTGSTSNTPVVIQTNNQERMRIGSTGNVAVNDTNTTLATMFVKGRASTTGFYTSGVGGANLYIDFAGGGNNYSDAITHYWRNTASTTLMTLDASGNLGVGTASPVARLDLGVPGNARFINAENGVNANFRATFSTNTVTFANSGGAGVLAFQTSASEAMRIASDGSVGIGTAATSTGKLNILTSTGGGNPALYISGNDQGNVRVRLVNTGTGGTSYSIVGGNPGVSNSGLGFYDETNSATRMYLDASGNLGIGVSPAYKLDVAGATRLGSGSSAIIATVGGAFVGGQGELYTVSTNSFGLGTTGSAPINFYTNSTIAAKIDASGNLGLGVTPSAWSAFKAMEFGAGAFASISTSEIDILQNAVYLSGTNWTYKATAAATMYRQGSGAHSWWNSASGSAGNSISFTQAMTLDASGRLAIGITTPLSSHKITAYGDDGGIVFQNSATGSGGTDGFQIGNYGTVNAYVYNYETASLIFGTAGTERARIDASGNLLVGTTSTSATSGQGVKILPGGLVYAVAPTSSGDNYNYFNTTASAYRFYVSSAGTINATSTTISAISDRRFKENIVDLDVGLDALLSLKPRKFDWKSGKGKDIKGDRGWIADEFQQVFPDLIDTWKDKPPEGEEPYKAVRPDLMPVVVKAIQELAAKVAELEAKI
jgi:hypothetical protein